MTNKKAIAGLVVLGLVVATLLIACGTIASVYAYRQFTAEDGSELSLAVRSRQADTEQPLAEQGVLVMRVAPESPAALAGLRRGSIILAVDGEEVNSPRDLQEAIRGHEAGDGVTLTVLNCDEPEEIEVTLQSAGAYLGVDVGGAPQTGPHGYFRGPLDLPPGEFTPPLPPDRFNPEELPGPPQPFHSGVIIFSVISGSPAEEVGLLPGDFITEVDGQAINSRNQLADLIGQKNPGDEVTLTVQRGAEMLTMMVTLAAHPDGAERGFLGVDLVPVQPQLEFSEPPETRG